MRLLLLLYIGFIVVLYFIFPWVFPEFLFFSSTFSPSSNEKSINFSLVREIFNEKKCYLVYYFEPEFLKCKIKLIITTKCYVTKYDQIMNQTLLQYHQVKKKCKNVSWLFPECFDFQEISPSFHSFPWFFNFSRLFPEFPGFPWVLWFNLLDWYGVLHLSRHT